MNSLNELKFLQRKIDEKISSISKEELISSLIELMSPLTKKVDKIEVRFYAPYFADGDPCIFQLQEVYTYKGDYRATYWGDLDYEGEEDEEDEVIGELVASVADSAMDTLRDIPLDLIERNFGSHIELIFEGDTMRSEYYKNHD